MTEREKTNEPQDAFDGLNLGFDKRDLVKLAHWEMPFGKYAGWALIDLPEGYLFWFEKHGFPAGELGRLLTLCLELKIEGLDGLIKPLKNGPQSNAG